MMQVKKAAVTGASRGIGRGIALRLAEAGYDVAVCYATKKEDAEALAAQIDKEYGRRCFIRQASLEKEGEGPAFVQWAAEVLGGLDLFVNNAGVTLLDSILTMKTEDIDYLIALNFRNYLLCAQAAARIMVKNKTEGSIISITSSRGQRAYPGDAVYGGIKAGLNRATESMALDLAPYGIRVNVVAPGAIRIRTREELEKQRPGMPSDFWDKIGERIPIPRSGMPTEVGDAVVFLASEKAAYITGVVLRVDGGLILPGIPETGDVGIGWGAQQEELDLQEI